MTMSQAITEYRYLWQALSQTRAVDDATRQLSERTDSLERAAWDAQSIFMDELREGMRG
jgi:hypothetical protein